jgi:CheY-like chemotaxis protein
LLVSADGPVAHRRLKNVMLSVHRVADLHTFPFPPPREARHANRPAKIINHPPAKPIIEGIIGRRFLGPFSPTMAPGPKWTWSGVHLGKACLALDASVRVLIVDDDPDLCESIRWILEGRAETTLAETATTALTLLKGPDQFDVILCDLRLGADDGLEVLREAATLQRQARRLLLTGHDPTILPRLGVRPGDAHEVLEKDKLSGSSEELVGVLLGPAGGEDRWRHFYDWFALTERNFFAAFGEPAALRVNQEHALETEPADSAGRSFSFEDLWSSLPWRAS